MRWFKLPWTDDSGATAIEYGLVISLISLAAISVFMELGSSSHTTTCSVNEKVVYAAETLKGNAANAPGQTKKCE